MVGLLRRFAGRRPVPAPVGRRLFVAPQETLEAAQTLFSRLPFDDALPSTALREALPSSATIENGSARSFLERLGRLPYRGGGGVEHLATWDCGDYIQEHLALHTSENQAVPVYLLIPKTVTGPMPALVAIHGHGGSYLWGKSKVSSSRAKTAAYGYGVRLVRQGYVVLAPDLIAFEERRFDSVVATGPWPDDAERLVFGNLLLNGGTLAGWTLLELSHAIDYLLSRDDVDGNRIGVIGHSMGGTLAPLLMLFDRRVQVGVASCGLSTWKAMMARHVIHNYSCYVPGLTESADLDVLLGAIAPRPLMVLAGQQDHNFPPDGVRAMADKLAGAYAAHGAGDALKVHIHDGGHVFDEPLQLQASSFLGRWLSARQSQQAASR